MGMRVRRPPGGREGAKTLGSGRTNEGPSQQLDLSHVQNSILNALRKKREEENAEIP